MKEFARGLIQRDERRDHGSNYDENADRDEKTNGPQCIEDRFVIHGCHFFSMLSGSTEDQQENRRKRDGNLRQCDDEGYFYASTILLPVTPKSHDGAR